MPEARGAYALDLVTVVLLSVATLATSWATYQATRWSGVQAGRYAQANDRRTESARAADLASGEQLADVVTFTSWLSAYGAGNTQLATFYRHRFRAEFRPAFEAWIESRPAVNPRAASGPFALPEYRLAQNEEAARLATEAERLFQEGQAANEHGDNYVLDSVVFSSVLFFAGISQQLHRRSMRLTLLALAGVLCLAGLGGLLRLPVA